LKQRIPAQLFNTAKRVISGSARPSGNSRFGQGMAHPLQTAPPASAPIQGKEGGVPVVLPECDFGRPEPVG